MKPKVRDYMTTNVVTVSPYQKIEEVIKLIEETGHDGFPVIKDGRIVGIITARDLIKAKKDALVKDVMKREVIVTFPDTNLIDVARVMFRMGISRLPVVDENKRLIGIITNTDVVRSHIERATPGKVEKIAKSIEKLHNVKTRIVTGRVKISKLTPTQDKIYPDEFRGREYEIKRGLAEPIIVIKKADKYILVDGHHRAFAAMKLGLEEIDAYIIELSKDIELGLEKMAKSLGLKSLKDVKIVNSEIGIAEIIKGDDI